jgi:pseudouridine-5'-phosphate glycosidase
VIHNGGASAPIERIVVHPEVAEAVSAGDPVVALESTIISHGLPRPENLRVAREIEAIVRSRGAVPATIAVLDGTVCVGLTDQQLTDVATRDDIVKASVRDLPAVVARSASAATTVAATSLIARNAGIEVFATGGLGGVHRQARDSWDESADLTTLGTTPVVVVCSGVKSILDVGATLERLETLNIAVLGYQTSKFPGFYLTDSGHPIDWRVDDPAEAADVMAAREVLGITSAIVVANPIPMEEQLDPDIHDATLTEGLNSADARGITGKDVTPFLLDHFHRVTHGASLMANATLVVRNAELAARIASARSLAQRS